MCDCSICFNQITIKKISHSIELECGHYFHNSCIKSWCKTCFNNKFCPTCPICRLQISNEYLNILGIDFDYYSNEKFVSSIKNTIMLFEYIIHNKIYEDNDKLMKLIDKYPNEINDIIYMLEICFLRI